MFFPTRPLQFLRKKARVQRTGVETVRDTCILCGLLRWGLLLGLGVGRGLAHGGCDPSVPKLLASGLHCEWGGDPPWGRGQPSPLSTSPCLRLVKRALKSPASCFSGPGLPHWCPEWPEVEDQEVPFYFLALQAMGGCLMPRMDAVLGPGI